MNNLVLGAFFGLLAQMGTFIQLQGNAKYNWYEKYGIWLLLVSIPLNWLYIQSVKHLVISYNGELWPSRLIGFGIGIFVFSFMSYFMFKETITLKTMICIFLAILIILIKIFF